MKGKNSKSNNNNGFGKLDGLERDFLEKALQVHRAVTHYQPEPDLAPSASFATLVINAAADGELTPERAARYLVDFREEFKIAVETAKQIEAYPDTSVWNAATGAATKEHES
ncbi:MAG: hypothetical protein ABFD89_16895 [Bryobacteraceae bacterium]